MKAKLGILAIFLIIGWSALRAQQPDYTSLKQEAEKSYAEGSYSISHDLYAKLDSGKLSPEEGRWVKFRLADTEWRAQAATETADTTKYEEAQKQLEALVRDIQSEEDRDRVWVEVQESLGDYFWARRDSRNWSGAWPYYQAALDWWAGSGNLDLARDRYLKIVWTIARPAWVEPYYYYGYYGNIAPLEVIQNALKIAKSEDDKAHAHYLIAMTLRYQGSTDQRLMVTDEFEAALKAGKSTEWYDDALYYYSEWLMQNGRMIQREDGQWEQQPDYVRALELFRQFVAQHKKGESRYYDQAQQQIENITKPVISVGVSNIFIPGSEIQYSVSWRNTKRIDFALYPVDLTRDVQLTGGNDGNNNWLQSIHTTGKQKSKSWFKDTKDKGDYKPGQETMKLDDKLPAGAYLLEATIAGATARDLILVTDAALVLKTSGRQGLVYFCNATSGAPIPGASLKIWEMDYTNNTYTWHPSTATTDKDGLARFDLLTSQSNRTLFVSGISANNQAFSGGYAYTNNSRGPEWRIYAFTDRPAYRPNETAQWKFVARRYDGSVYSTPSDQVIEYEITDPRGTKVKEDKSTLNAFGSSWGSLELTDQMPLGEYRVQFYDQGRHTSIGSAQLFRIEEYKLPEFKVSVETPEENGKKKAFRLGDSVEVNIQADYYFGGAVSNANVEVVLYQNPYYHWWFPYRDYSWYYEDIYSKPYPYYGNGQVLKRETMKTDASGKAVFHFDTPRGAGQDFEYRIEARVTDSSRREIVGNGSVRVTQQLFYAQPDPGHYLYRPQDKVTVNFKTIDANDQPVEAEGIVKVTRDYWYETWISPEGKEVTGGELQALRDRNPNFPTPQDPKMQPWKLKIRGYQHEDILTRTIKTDAQGEAEFTFTPEREGYYRVAWSTPQKQAAPITAETTVWVVTNATTDMGYRYGGLEIVADKDTFRAGQKAPVMLVVPTNDRYVLFSVEGEDIYSYQLVHVTGNVKLVEIPLEEKHVPNIFLNGVMISDRQIYQDTKQVIVPPVENFLQVDLKPDREQYQPREEGTFNVTTRDKDGKPVAAEVALGLIDASVLYIQQDYAGDPRQFYFGQKRPQTIQTQSTFNQKSYIKWVETENNVLVNERDDKDAGERQFLPNTNTFSARDEVSQTGAPAEMKKTGALGGMARANKEEAAKPVMAAPASAPVPQSMDSAITGEKVGAEGEPAVVVRNDFRSTIFWQPDVVTGANGTATVRVKYPDSLTGWKATARVISTGNQFGIADASTRTKQPLIVRLQAPRFFVEGDKTTISAVINNNTDNAMSVTPSLDVEGLVLAAASKAAVNVPANGESRVDWIVTAAQSGSAKLKVTAKGSQYADAMEKMYTVYEHGIDKYIAKSGKMRGDEVLVKLDIPAARRKESTTLSIQATPSMAVTMLDALPYLIDYPYGCTEQTMSRFLPAAIVAKTLKDLGIARNGIEGKLFGGIETESADKTHPAGKKEMNKLNDMTRKSLDRLYDFQHSDGGWGWWKEGDSDHYMTAYVVWGMTVAQAAGIEVRADSLSRGATYLQSEIVEEEENYDQQAWMLHALSAYHTAVKSGTTEFETKALANLWKNRDRLNAYSRALLALSANAYGDAEKAQTLIRNLENGVKIDNAPDTSIVMRGEQSSDASVIGTAHWGEDGIWWRWSDGPIESTSFALRAILAIDPHNKLVEPITNWLVKNRRGSQWSNTKDTAIAILALTDYLKVSGEMKSDLEYEVSANGHVIATRKVSAQDILSAPSTFAVDRKYILDGSNEIRIRRVSGNGMLYFAANAKFFSLEEPIPAAGSEIFVRRQYFKLVGKPTLLKGYTYERMPLNDGGNVKSGERIETVVTVETKNDYEYLLFEDLKPAGFEAVEVRSGEPLYAKEIKSGSASAMMADRGAHAEATDYTGRTEWIYQELRDRKVAMFATKLPQGVWEIRYTLRAETPGEFHALPLMGQAMYVPEIRANDAEIRVTVVDTKE